MPQDTLTSLGVTKLRPFKSVRVLGATHEPQPGRRVCSAAEPRAFAGGRDQGEGITEVVVGNDSVPRQ